MISHKSYPSACNCSFCDHFKASFVKLGARGRGLGSTCSQTSIKCSFHNLVQSETIVIVIFWKFRILVPEELGIVRCGCLPVPMSYPLSPGYRLEYSEMHQHSAMEKKLRSYRNLTVPFNARYCSKSLFRH